MVIIVGVLSFAIVAGVCSWAIGKRATYADTGETSVSVLLVSWAALLFGMFVMRFL